MVCTRTVSLVAACFMAVACGEARAPGPAAPAPADGRVQALADAYLEGFLARNPDQATLYGIPGRHHDKLPDNSMAALRAWQNREDLWLQDAKGIDPAGIS